MFVFPPADIQDGQASSSERETAVVVIQNFIRNRALRRHQEAERGKTHLTYAGGKQSIADADRSPQIDEVSVRQMLMRAGVHKVEEVEAKIDSVVC